ncbi:MAG TPA: glutamate--tRNA ligase [Saprospiraceae bacterium]|nr:glutamate--tRNA ligase [Saprospiraceae bacterium]HNT21805.1 glutamate--tRNA ligase [Saprospiraceae bacterium]
MSVRVRFAPSPTGALHIGGVRTALYNYLFAKKNHGIFILRIEDTDQARYVPGAEEYILDALRWCGIEPTEGQGYGGKLGPYRQSERKAVYREAALQLVESGKAYYAFDTEEELDRMRARLADAGVAAPKYDASVRMEMRNSLSLDPLEVTDLLRAGTPHVVRLRVDPGKQVVYRDLIREEVRFDTTELDDKVLIKADGMPTYHLANVVDDHHMDISHVIRGEEWLSSTAHHLLLYEAFEWSPPRYAHLPLIMRPDGKGKLSKRDGARFGIPVFPLSWKGDTAEESFTGFREFGFEPEAVLNFLAFLGWNPGTDQELFSLDELVEAFDLGRVHRSGARFDMDKALWFNHQYIKQRPVQEIVSKLKPLVEARGWLWDERKCLEIVPLFTERVNLVSEIPDAAGYLFSELRTMDEEAVRKHWKPELGPVISELVKILEAVEPFEAQALEQAAKAGFQSLNVKPGQILPILRLALAGGLQGPGVFQMLQILGKQGLSRIRTFVARD